MFRREKGAAQAAPFFLASSRNAPGVEKGNSLRLEHFPAKWTPVRRRKCDQCKESRAHPDSFQPGCALCLTDPGPRPRSASDLFDSESSSGSHGTSLRARGLTATATPRRRSMHTPELFLARASECESMAQTAPDPASKETWMRMAARWQRCAQIEANAISIAHRDSDSNSYRKRAPGWSLPSQRSSRT